jgi:hypothetical protein
MQDFQEYPLNEFALNIGLVDFLLYRLWMRDSPFEATLMSSYSRSLQYLLVISVNRERLPVILSERREASHPMPRPAPGLLYGSLQQSSWLQFAKDLEFDHVRLAPCSGKRWAVCRPEQYTA